MTSTEAKTEADWLADIRQRADHERIVLFQPDALITSWHRDRRVLLDIVGRMEAGLSRSDEADDIYRDRHERAFRHHILNAPESHVCTDLCSGAILDRLAGRVPSNEYPPDPDAAAQYLVPADESIEAFARVATRVAKLRALAASWVDEADEIDKSLMELRREAAAGNNAARALLRNGNRREHRAMLRSDTLRECAAALVAILDG